MKDLKDWSQSITGLAALEGEAVINLYSEMLATAHDLGYKVPDAQLIETEDPEALRAVMPALHEGLIKFHAAAKADAEEKAKAAAKAPKPIKKTKVKATEHVETTSSHTLKASELKQPKKPAAKVVQKASKEKVPVAKAAKKAAVAAPVAKAAKAPAKKAAKKGAAKKAAKANAREPVARAQPGGYKEGAVIKVKDRKDNPARADSERGKRIAVVYKYDGKKVSDYFAKEKAPYNRNDTLRFLVDKGYITIK